VIVVVNWPQFWREWLWSSYHKSEIARARSTVSSSAILQKTKDISETHCELVLRASSLLSCL